MIKEDTVFLAKEPVVPLVWRLALPAIVAQVINMLYNLVDRVYIGHIEDVGPLALTGVGICFPIIILVMAFANLIAMGSAPIASIELGKRNLKKAERILGNSFILLLIISAILTFILVVFKNQILLAFGASENTLHYASSYLGIYSLGTVFVMFAVGLNAFISAQGYTKISMYTVLIGAVANIILDPIFIFYFGMGVKGAAIATVISQAISSLWVIYFLTSKKTVIKIKKENFKIVFSVIGPCLGLGLAPFIMSSTESILLIAFNSSLLKYGGDIAVGAMTILSSILQFIRLPLTGFSQGAQPVISYNYGAENISRVKKAISVLFKVDFTYAMTMFILIELFPRFFIRIFTPDNALIEYCIWSLRIYIMAAGVFGIQNAVQISLVSMGKAKISVSIAVLRKLVLLIPLIYILPIFMEDKVFAVILAEPVADFISVAYASIIFFILYKRELSKM